MKGKTEEIQVHIAPMVDVSNRYFRTFMKLISPRVVVWSEMIKDDAILYNKDDPAKMAWLLGKREGEGRTVFQLGGSDPTRLAEAASIVEAWGYDEINLNVGCPSNRVACKGEFGASLMKNPDLVRACLKSMKSSVTIPVTVKTRLGVDDFDTPEYILNFINTISESGCDHYYIHARKAWLKGLSPAQNRSIPPLNYERVYWLAEQRPDLNFTLNGGLNSLQAGVDVLRASPRNLTGVMYGRLAMSDPASFHEVEQVFFGGPSTSLYTSRGSVLEAYAEHLVDMPLNGIRTPCNPGMCNAALKPCMQLLKGFHGKRQLAQSIEAAIRDPSSKALGPGRILLNVYEQIVERHHRCLDLPFTSELPPPWVEPETGDKEE
eukprot:TRINITY_DN30230_c0_g1_i1.p1 TRINITY_DN30230_c0_g1~~TRINITY_DN30230_c0_g1_i1.p1  ORF type:complete len:377 (+),score=34.51 TRINITY_DN30230_c0_g1_i1:40-1170(+)